MQKEASETVQSSLRNRLVPRIAKVYLRKTPNGTKILLIRQSKTSVWHKQLLSTPPATHVNREGKRLACEKHMDWWPASRANNTTIGNRGLCSTSALTEERLQMPLAARFLNGDVAEMVERSVCMREVRGSTPRISNFSEEYGNKKGNTGSCFVRSKDDMDLYVQYGKEASETVQNLLRKRLVSRITQVYLRKTSEETLLYW